MTTASLQLDDLIAGLTDWRGRMLSDLRKAILEVDPGIVEEWKWMGSPVWSLGGIIAVGNAHKDKVKLTFPHGAALPDPDQVFNNGLGGGKWRSIDWHEGDAIRQEAFKALVRAAIDHNRNKPTKKRSPRKAAVKQA